MSSGSLFLLYKIYESGCLMRNTNLLLCIFEIPPYCGWLAPELVLCVCVRPSLCLSYSFKAVLLSLGCRGSAHPVFRLFSEETISYIVVVLSHQWEERSSGSSSATTFLFSWRQIFKSYLYFFCHELACSYNLPVFLLDYLYFYWFMWVKNMYMISPLSMI